jgi:hypothetical protein
MMDMKALIGLLVLAAAIRPHPAWAAAVFNADSSAILAAARADAAGVPDQPGQGIPDGGGKPGPHEYIAPELVPQDLIDNVKRTMRNITGNAFSAADLDLLTKMVIKTISISPFATVSLAEVLKLGSLDPNAKPMVLTGAQARVINDIFKSLGKDRLTPQEQGLYKRAQAEWAKARSNGSVVVKG